MPAQSFQHRGRHRPKSARPHHPLPKTSGARLTKDVETSREDRQLLFWQTRDSAVADKDGARLVSRFGCEPRDFEIEHTHTKSRLPFVSPAIARPNHDALVGCFLATKINHCVGNIGIAIDAIGAAPEKKITRFERIKFKSVVAVPQHCLEVTGLTHPNVLLACVARDIAYSIFRKHIMNETRAIHSTIGRIGRTVFVCEILSR
jgi:hypothetical protein